MANEISVEEQQSTEGSLESAVQEYLTQLRYQLRKERDQDKRDKINHQIAIMVPVSLKLQADGIQIIAARSKDDLANIVKVSNDVKHFVYQIKRVEDMVSVAISIVEFVVVCIADTRDPVAIWNAGNKVYDAMNKVIKSETPKGSEAAIKLSKLKTLMVPSLLGGQAPVAKIAVASDQKKPARAGAKKKTR